MGINSTLRVGYFFLLERLLWLVCALIDVTAKLSLFTKSCSSLHRFFESVVILDFFCSTLMPFFTTFYPLSLTLLSIKITSMSLLSLAGANRSVHWSKKLHSIWLIMHCEIVAFLFLFSVFCAHTTDELTRHVFHADQFIDA